MNAIDITGMTFGRLVAIRRTPSRRMSGRMRIFWLCRCACGNEVEVQPSNLKGGNIASCGCLAREIVVARSTTHGMAAREDAHPLYASWSKMLARCRNPNNPSFKDYGGRGVQVCERWHSFENFLADMGERPEHGMSLDRFPDQNGNYEPGNVRWATSKEQNRNRRDNVLESHEPEQIRWLFGLGYSRIEIAGYFDVSRKVIESVVRGDSWS
jgi:hypothetical protein